VHVFSLPYNDSHILSIVWWNHFLRSYCPFWLNISSKGLLYAQLFIHFNKNVDIKFSAHDAFLE
jgi:hypothetical protein